MFLKNAGCSSILTLILPRVQYYELLIYITNMNWIQILYYLQSVCVVQLCSYVLPPKWHTYTATTPGRIKGYNSYITTIMCQGGSYRTVVGYL